MFQHLYSPREAPQPRNGNNESQFLALVRLSLDDPVALRAFRFLVFLLYLNLKPAAIRRRWPRNKPLDTVDGVC